MFFSKFPFLRITGCFILGILVHAYFPQYYEGLRFALAIFLLLHVVVLLYNFWYETHSFLRGYVLIVLSAGSGYFLTGMHDVTLSTKITDQLQWQSYLVHVNSLVEKNANNYRCTAQIVAFYQEGNSFAHKEKIYLYMPKTDSLKIPKAGDILRICQQPKPIQKALNPKEFDFRSYAARQGITGMHYLRYGNYSVVGFRRLNPVVQAAYDIRALCSNYFKTYIGNSNEAIIASALVLGIRSFIDNELKNAYAATGTLHVLAVSGMHVGIIYKLLEWMLLLCMKNSKWRWTRCILLITSLWGYAFITGFSPSVLRAVAMFSIIIVGNTLQKTPQNLNTLSFSGLVLLCIHPWMLFEVGFQLSFAAVTGILLLYDRIYQLLTFTHTLTDFFWQITAVSLAAQIATFPISVYYFHQFPLYFLLSNWIVIPVVTIVLYAGIGLLLIFWLPDLATLLGKIIYLCIHFINQTVLHIEKWPFASIQKLYLSTDAVLLIYICGLALYVSFVYHHKKSLYVALCFSVLLFGTMARHVVQSFTTSEICVYHVPGSIALEFFEGSKSTLFVSDTSQKFKKKLLNKRSNYLLEMHTKSTQWYVIPTNVSEISLHSKQNQTQITIGIKDEIISIDILKLNVWNDTLRNKYTIINRYIKHQLKQPKEPLKYGKSVHQIMDGAFRAQI